MKKIQVLILSLCLPYLVFAADPTPLPRLTVELRDGSRVVGDSVAKNFKFNSALLGEIKLAVKDIRSVECVSSNSAKLATANGDSLTVSFMDSAIAVKSSFGKVELPVNSLRSLKVSAAGKTAAAAGHLVGWWKLDEGNGTVAKDSSAQNPHDGKLLNGSSWAKTPGHSETALCLNGANQYVALGDILQGSYQAISIACWVKHGTSQWQNIVERGSWADPDGIGLMMDYNTTSVSFGHYSSAEVKSIANVQDNRWHHVVGTMLQSDSNYIYSIYVDGKLDNTATDFLGLTATTKPWAIGARYDGTWSYGGLVKDVRIYDCALSAEEINSIYHEINPDELPSTPVPAMPFNGIYRNGPVFRSGPGVSE